MFEQYSVSDILTWLEDKSLVLNANFQRRSVWPPIAKNKKTTPRRMSATGSGASRKASRFISVPPQKPRNSLLGGSFYHRLPIPRSLFPSVIRQNANSDTNSTT